MLIFLVVILWFLVVISIVVLCGLGCFVLKILVSCIDNFLRLLSVFVGLVSCVCCFWVWVIVLVLVG